MPPSPTLTIKAPIVGPSSQMVCCLQTSEMLHHVVDVAGRCWHPNHADGSSMHRACLGSSALQFLFCLSTPDRTRTDSHFCAAKLRVGTVTAEDMGHRLHMFRVDEVEKARGAAPGQATIRSNSTRQRRLPSCGARDFGCVLRIFSATCHAGRIVDLCSQDSGAQLLSRRDC